MFRPPLYPILPVLCFSFSSVRSSPSNWMSLSCSLPLSLLFQVSEFSAFRSSLFKSMLRSGRGLAVEQEATGLHTHSPYCSTHTRADQQPHMLTHPLSSISLVFSLQFWLLFLQNDIDRMSGFWWICFLRHTHTHIPTFSPHFSILFLRVEKWQKWREQKQE